MWNTATIGLLPRIIPAMLNTCDFLIIGGGVMGLCLALETRRRYPSARITVLEKESACGLHASGRNSGVLHAGFYYATDSLKARFTRDGCQHWSNLCRERGLKINRCGKLVVTQNPSELSTLDELLRLGMKNGVTLEKITSEQAKKIEPLAKTCQAAIFSPTTASVDPQEVMAFLEGEARQTGIDIQTGTGYLGRSKNLILSSRGKIDPGYVINAAGLYADRIARDFGFAHDYTILPFKGLYLYSDSPPGSLKTNIYPVPNLKNPFLGVHFTLTVDGRVKIGPTAIPAFWREHYQGWGGFKAEECFDILQQQAGLFLRNDFSFRQLAFEEIKKYRRPYLTALAGQLAVLDPNSRWHWGKPGIRAQLLHLPSRQLVMDFLFEGDHRSGHVLNAVSPGLTCAPPFSAYLLDRIEEKKPQFSIEKNESSV